MPAEVRSHDLPWDHEGFCTAEDAEQEDLPLYHEAAVEAWVLEQETGFVAREPLAESDRARRPVRLER